MYRRVRELGLLPGEDQALDAALTIVGIDAYSRYEGKLNVRTHLRLN